MRPALLAAVSLLLLACGEGTPDTVADRPAQEPTPAPAIPGGPVPLGCEAAVPATRVRTPRGLVVPDGVRVIAASRTGRPDDPRITIVEGYVERVPSELVKAFKAQKGVSILFSEDEEFEAEVLVSDGSYKTFWKVVRVCLAASRFTALYSSERAGDAVARAAPPTKKPVRRR